MTLSIFNTLSRSNEVFIPIEAKRVRMYVCGMTLYDLCHMGHARFLMAFDVVYRWLLASGFDVTYVRNITDIDDKIIKRALERNMSIRELVDDMTVALHEDLLSLGIASPTHEPRATDYVPQMLSIISALEAKGLAYRAPDGDVNFAVRKFPGYGKLSGKTIDQLRAGERVAVADGKNDPLDFVLWKAAKESEPEDAKWDSAYGRGRPGWHIECSAMSCAILGEHFDIHGGGIDLQFPHHENEIAQSEGATGRPFVNYWMHNGHLNVDNQKMSKSVGNFFTIRDVLAHHDGETLRFFMLRTHYRSPFNFSEANLNDARSALRRLYTALDGVAVPDGEVDWNQASAAAFKLAMDDDFNTSGAVAVLFELASEVNRTQSVVAAVLAATLLKRLGAVLGLLQQAPRIFLQSGNALDEASIQLKIEQRKAAKLARDFALSDRIRDELLAAGIVLQDSAAGTTWMKA